MNQKNLEPVINALNDLQCDAPKNLHEKISNTLKLLRGDDEFSIMKSKVLSELEDLSESSHLESYARMQLLNIVSLLEGL